MPSTIGISANKYKYQSNFNLISDVPLVKQGMSELDAYNRLNVIAMKFRSILLQCKFLLVEFLNITYNFVPNPLRNYYFRIYGIRIGGVKHHYTEGAGSFMWARCPWGRVVS